MPGKNLTLLATVIAGRLVAGSVLRLTPEVKLLTFTIGVEGVAIVNECAPLMACSMKSAVI